MCTRALSIVAYPQDSRASRRRACHAPCYAVAIAALHCTWRPRAAGGLVRCTLVHFETVRARVGVQTNRGRDGVRWPAAAPCRRRAADTRHCPAHLVALMCIVVAHINVARLTACARLADFGVAGRLRCKQTQVRLSVAANACQVEEPQPTASAILRSTHLLHRLLALLVASSTRAQKTNAKNTSFQGRAQPT